MVSEFKQGRWIGLQWMIPWLVLLVLQEMRQQMLRDIKVLSEAQQVPGLLSSLGAYLVPQRDQVRVCGTGRGHATACKAHCGKQPGWVWPVWTDDVAHTSPSLMVVHGSHDRHGSAKGVQCTVPPRRPTCAHMQCPTAAAQEVLRCCR